MKKYCGNCIWHHREKVTGGWVCVKRESEYCTEETEYDFCCDEHESRKSVKVVSRFTIGGTAAGPSVPSGAIERALGTKIGINIFDNELYVPTKSGTKTAKVGDTIVAYDNGTFDVEEKKE